MEKFGRTTSATILVDRVEEGRDFAAGEAEGGESSTRLEAFRGRWPASRAATSRRSTTSWSDEVRVERGRRGRGSRSASTRSRTSSKALFEEWDGEMIDEMQDKELKRSSREMLDDTRARYSKLITAMRNAESKMEPVLVKLKDHVTFLKHNLNARAVASLQKNLVTIETDVSALVADMEKSIAEADAFIAAMNSEG
jgi:hypothetical protein